MRILLIVLFGALSSSFDFGESVAILTCKTSTGKIILKVEIPQGKYLESATFYQNGKKVVYSFEAKADIVFKPANKKFSIYLSEAGKPDIRLVGDENNFKLIKHSRGPGTEFVKIYSFKGKLIEANRPLLVDCFLDYEL